MKNLENFGVQELNKSETENTLGGIPWPALGAAVAAIGAGMAWAFEKGAALGKAMA
ncbi:hypothetical protein ACSTS3_18550 [Aquimarina muelleri]|uniref:hypothetical protein n=1 Tax=Aquimarina muelleri TaxID=279356 RepID=UPI003F6840A8